jgi:hypothetical protein
LRRHRARQQPREIENNHAVERCHPCRLPAILALS